MPLTSKDRHRLRMKEQEKESEAEQEKRSVGGASVVVSDDRNSKLEIVRRGKKKKSDHLYWWRE